MLKNKDELQTYLSELNGSFEGYVQMSAVAQVRQIKDAVPDWNALHENSTDFIVEMALFDTTAKKSVLIRQQNDKWQVRETVIPDASEASESWSFESYDVLTPDMQDGSIQKCKIATQWQPRANPQCLDMEVLEPVAHYFAGYERKTQGGSDD
jgi:CRISPR type III-associated protein (TIGR04423 family)